MLINGKINHLSALQVIILVSVLLKCLNRSKLWHRFVIQSRNYLKQNMLELNNLCIQINQISKRSEKDYFNDVISAVFV